MKLHDITCEPHSDLPRWDLNAWKPHARDLRGELHEVWIADDGIIYGHWTRTDMEYVIWIEEHQGEVIEGDHEHSLERIKGWMGHFPAPWYIGDWNIAEHIERRGNF